MNKTMLKETTSLEQMLKNSKDLSSENGRVPEKNRLVPLEEEAALAKCDLTLEELIKKAVELSLDDSSYYDSQELDETLKELFNTQKDLFDSFDIERELKERRFLSKTGHIISTEHCTHTIKDTFRVRAYLRGAHQALRDLFQKFPNEELHIIYPACGPFAPLLLPLINFYKQTDKEKKVKVTLIDIQEAAAISLESLIQELDIEEYIEEILVMDAIDYTPKENQKISLVILEAINHGFTKEGHLSLSRHFAPMLRDGGIFLPYKVTVKAFLNTTQKEYVDQWKNVKKTRMILRDKDNLEGRTEVGDILTLTQDNIQNLKEVPSSDPDIKLIECATLTIPTPKGEYDTQALIMGAHLEIYKDEKLGEYDSGITHPLPQNNFCLNFTPLDLQEEDVLIKSGDIVSFYYRLDGEPSFIPFKKKELNQ